MDDLDEHLLDRLRENARALGLSRTTIQSRLARLERTGVIAGYSVRLSETREGALIRGFVMLAVEPKEAVTVAAALRRLAGVRTLLSVSGPFDMIATTAVADLGATDALMDEIRALKGVEQINVSLVLATRFDR